MGQPAPKHNIGGVWMLTKWSLWGPVRPGGYAVEVQGIAPSESDDRYAFSLRGPQTLKFRPVLLVSGSEVPGLVPDRDVLGSRNNSDLAIASVEFAVSRRIPNQILVGQLAPDRLE